MESKDPISFTQITSGSFDSAANITVSLLLYSSAEVSITSTLTSGCASSKALIVAENCGVVSLSQVVTVRVFFPPSFLVFSVCSFPVSFFVVSSFGVSFLPHPVMRVAAIIADNNKTIGFFIYILL